MRETAAQLKKVLTRIAVFFVLRNRVGHSLFREAVLQLEGCYGQPVDENRKVKGHAPIGLAVMQLARYRESVLRVERSSRIVPRRRRCVEERNIERVTFGSVAEYLYNALLGNLGPSDVPETCASLDYRCPASKTWLFQAVFLSETPIDGLGQRNILGRNRLICPGIQPAPVIEAEMMSSRPRSLVSVVRLPLLDCMGRPDSRPGVAFMLGESEKTPRRGFENSFVSGMSDVSMSASDMDASASNSAPLVGSQVSSSHIFSFHARWPCGR